MRFWQLSSKPNLRDFFGHSCSCINLLFLSPHDICKTCYKKIIENDEKRLRKKVVLMKTDYEEGRLQPTPASHPTLSLSLRYFEKKKMEKIIKIDEKRLRSKVTLIKTDYKERILQPTPSGHPQLATPRANYFLLVYKSFQIFIFWILGLKLGKHLQEPIAPRGFWIWHYRTITSPRINQTMLDSTRIC
jgi:hypothetical protein